MRLFEIHDAIERLLNESVTPEGEINEAALAELDALEMARDAKALAVASYALGQDVEADAIEASADAVKAQADKMRERARIHRNHAERLRRYIEANVPAGTKLADDRVSISWRRSQAVCITDEEKLPPAVWRVKRDVDKAAIRDWLKAGHVVPGASLEERVKLVVK